MASEIACGPRWPLFNLHGVNILSNSQDPYGTLDNYEEQSDDDEPSKDGEQPPDEEQGKDLVLLVFLMLKNQACAHWGKQARYEGHGEDEKQSEDPLVLVFVKFMGQLWRLLQKCFSLHRFSGVVDLRPSHTKSRISFSDYRKDGHDVAHWRRFSLIYTAILCYVLCLPAIQHALNRGCNQLSYTQCASSNLLWPKQRVAVIISRVHMQHVLDNHSEDSDAGHQLEDAPAVAKPQNLQISLSSGSGDPGSEPNSTSIITPDMFSDFLWFDEYLPPFAYPPIYATGSSSAPATDPFPGQLLQPQQEVLPAPISDQNLQDGDENSIHSVENPGTKEVPSTGSTQQHTGRGEKAVYSCAMCPKMHFIGKKEFERHTDEQHRHSLLFPCHYLTCKRHEHPFARKENLNRHVKSQHPEDRPNLLQHVNKACDRASVNSSATHKRNHDSGEDQQPLTDEYSTNEKEYQSREKRQRIQEDTSETGHLRLENDRLRGENDDLKRQLQNLKGKYDERGDLVNRLLGRLEK